MNKPGMISRMGHCVVSQLLIALIARGIKNREELLSFDFFKMLFHHPSFCRQRTRMSASM